MNFERRFDNWANLVPSCIVDVTECPIRMPTYYEWEYFSFKKQQHTLKYEMAISVKKPQIIVWINGLYKRSVPDLTIAKDKLIPALKLGECPMGDKGYNGSPHFLTPLKPARNPSEKNFNYKHNRTRQSVERMFKRLKHFSFLRHKWRNRISLHKYYFYVIAYLTQVTLFADPLTC